MVERDACRESNATVNGGTDRAEQLPTPSAYAARKLETEDGTLARNNAQRFSLFRWFRRNGNRGTDCSASSKSTSPRTGDDARDVERRHSVASSIDSIGTFYSTTTVRSFAFHPADSIGNRHEESLGILTQAAEVGPFAAGASKLLSGNKAPGFESTNTLPANILSRHKDITTRYSLQPAAPFNSCGNLSDSGTVGTLRRIKYQKDTVGQTIRRKAHVKGKRRAPNPPILAIPAVDNRSTSRNSNRRKRPAPKPPVINAKNASAAETSKKIVDETGMDVERRKEVDQAHAISNDTLILRGGVLLPKKEVHHSPQVIQGTSSTIDKSEVVSSREGAVQNIGLGVVNPAMPRPWYKRSVIENRDAGHSRRGEILRGPTTSAEVKDECCGTSTSYSADMSLTKISFFRRNDRYLEERKRDIKRRSGISILTNISELDKEATAIVQEEQARNRASMFLNSSIFGDDDRSNMNRDLVQDIVTSSMEPSSPRRSTRALISKFNAISNIAKVTVNTNFFTKDCRYDTKSERNITKNGGYDNTHDWRNSSRFFAPRDQKTRNERDISKYFVLQENPKDKVKEESKSRNEVGKIMPKKEQDDRLTIETTNRISFLQSQLAANRIKNSTRLSDIDSKSDNKLSQEVLKRKEGKGLKLEDEFSAGYLLPSNRVPPSNTKHEKQLKNGDINLNKVQKEFANIANNINQPVTSAQQFPIGKQTRNVKNNQSDLQKSDVIDNNISRNVIKVFDILVEAEKDSKTRLSRILPDDIIYIDETPEIEINPITSITKLPPQLIVNDPAIVDLKEMLKEMKHSLPKKPKPRQSVAADNGPIERIISPATKSPITAKTQLNKTLEIHSKPSTSQKNYEVEKQKTSSSVQTSGNLRKLNQSLTLFDEPSTSTRKPKIEVTKEKPAKNTLEQGLVKNTFQLIRPRDFSEIEACKTTKAEQMKENAYANVIEQSLYANTVVPSLSCIQRNSRSLTDKTIINVTTKNPENAIKKTEIEDESMEEGELSNRNNMNTLAVNRLLRRLEAAIASGHHQQAAGLAKELARLKIQCSVVRQRSVHFKDELIRTNMYIEDKLAHQGPIPLQLPTRMTVAELKTKVQMEFEIPTNVQRWIIGKNLADHDDATLEELQAKDGSPIFLYLATPRSSQKETSQAVKEVVIEDVPDTTEQFIAQSNLPIITEIHEDEVKQKSREISLPQREMEVQEAKIDQYEELLSLENCDVIPNSEPIECPICFVTYGPREGVILRDCLHMFCRSCLANTILYCEDAEVKCPYRDSDYFCESTLQEREIKALVEPDIYEQHLAKSVSQAENSAGKNAFHCKTPNCRGWCFYDDDVNNFLCPVCNTNNCLTCQAIHIGRNCKQYQEHLLFSKETDQESRRTAEMLEEMVDRGEALPCPTCAVVLMKKWGCDWLRCSMCKTEICWVTKGPRWGPAGNGDTSGGCRCGENGIKCHPRCNYCH